MKNTDDVDEHVTTNIQILLKDDTIQKIFENRALIKTCDSTRWFCDQIKRIGKNAYTPTNQK